MRKWVEATGKTVENAIENGLRELGVTRDKVTIDIVESGNKGVFGLLGAKPAKVKLTLKKDYSAIAKTFLREVLDKMGIMCEIQIKEEEDVLKINLAGPRMGALIGHRGETLDSLQYLVSLVVNKENSDNEFKKVLLDTQNYRQKREETLIKLANRLAYKVKRYNKSITLEPMNPYERRIIHAALQNHPEVTTYSIGEEPYRKVVIDLKK